MTAPQLEGATPRPYEWQETAIGIVFELARETLRRRDDLIEGGWIVNPMPHDAEVRALLDAGPAALVAAPSRPVEREEPE